MQNNGDVPELLEAFMDQCGETERWITVSEIREYFNLDTLSGPAISGFLSKIHRGTFFSCPYRVERIERMVVDTPHPRTIKRYLVKRRPFSTKKQSSQKEHGGFSRPPSPEGIFTDSSALEIFDTVLERAGMHRRCE